jgi:hypothetical protein
MNWQAAAAPRQCGGRPRFLTMIDNNNDDYGDEWERAFSEKCDQAKRERDRDSGAYQAEIARLAALPKVAYEVERKAAAKRLGMRASVLDAMVKAERPEDQKDDFALPHWNVQPWPSAVSGAELLNDLAAIFRKHIYIPPTIADAAALWGAHAWTIDAGDISPFFVLVSPTKRAAARPACSFF